MQQVLNIMPGCPQSYETRKLSILEPLYMLFPLHGIPFPWSLWTHFHLCFQGSASMLLSQTELYTSTQHSTQHRVNTYPVNIC